MSVFGFIEHKGAAVSGHSKELKAKDKLTCDTCGVSLAPGALRVVPRVSCQKQIKVVLLQIYGLHILWYRVTQRQCCNHKIQSVKTVSGLFTGLSDTI